MDRQGFDELKTTGKLPSPSGVAMRIMELCREEDAPLADMDYVLRADPALSGRLIRFANSALTGGHRPVASAVDAIRLLGLNTVRQLALGFSLLSENRTGICRGFDYRGFWSRSLASAIAANALCLRTRTAPADEAFTCGLLANIGRLALASLYPDQYAEAISESVPDLGATLLRERALMGTDHVEMTAALLDAWHIPGMFVSAIAYHEEPHKAEYPDSSRESTLCHLLHLAVMIGVYCGADERQRKTMLSDLIFGGARVGLDAESLSLLTDQVVSDWREWGRVLEVPTTEVPRFQQMMQSLDEPAAKVVVEAATEVSRVHAHSAAPVAVAREGETLRILLVDDNATTLAVLSRILTQQGHEVSIALDGEEALRVAMRDRPQMIVSDWIMPRMDGISLCRALRDTEEGRQMYFLLLTALEEEEKLVEAFEAGVDDYVTKPVSARLLTARLRAGMRVIRLQEEAERDSQSLRRFATELAVVNRRLRQAALTDPLTGLPNRRHAMERLEQEWAAYSRNQRAFSVMMIDIDRFKAVNDAYGHETGDQALRQVASILRKAARSEDVICRLGGEEFLVISPDTLLPAGLRLADRLRQSVCNAPITLGTLRHTLSISIGVAQLVPTMVSFDQLLKAADDVLYHAKRLGGNRVKSPGMGVSERPAGPES
jgi:diguanylate cyclase (GGDEF)-like protein